MKLLRTAALALALLAPLSSAAAGPAADHITAMSAQAIAALQASGSTLAEREKALRPVLREGFDMGRIARFVAGRYWKRATPEQQKRIHASIFRIRPRHIRPSPWRICR